jgi:hypothetical protein
MTKRASTRASWAADRDDLTAVSSLERDRRGEWRYRFALLAALLTLGVAFEVFTAECIHKASGHLVYALDDAYISMAAARNLAQHGTLGVCTAEFAALASSLAWVLLMAVVYWCIGAHQWVPLAMNIVCASALVTMVWAILKNRGIGPLVCYLLLVLIMLWTPIVPIAFTGLEHILQACVVLVFAYATGQSLGADVPPEVQAKAVKVVLFLSPLVTLVRYEGLFLLAVVGAIFLIRRRIGVALLVVALGLLPITVAGVAFLWKGWYFFPSSVVLKGNVPLHTSWPDIFDVVKTALSSWESASYVTILIGAILAIFVFYNRGILRLQSGIMAVVFLGTSVLHIQLAKLGWFYRYEAYLVVLGVVTLILLLYDVSLRAGYPWRSLVPRSGPTWAKCLVVAIPLLFLTHPLTQRGLAAHIDVAKASVNNYQQQYQMGLFLHKYYEGAGVAANDIGAINFLADIRCLDLIGLANIEVLRMRRAGAFDTAQIRRLTHEKGVRIAIIYDQWFSGKTRVPPEWTLVGTWTIPNNVVCGGETVAFYAVDSAEAIPLCRHLGEFQSQLPADVAVALATEDAGGKASASPQ